MHIDVLMLHRKFDLDFSGYAQFRLQFFDIKDAISLFKNVHMQLLNNNNTRHSEFMYTDRSNLFIKSIDFKEISFLHHSYRWRKSVNITITQGSL